MSRMKSYIFQGVPVTDENGGVRGVFMRVRFIQSTAFIREAFQLLQDVVLAISEKVMVGQLAEKMQTLFK